jgi:hypothetical protein
MNGVGNPVAPCDNGLITDIHADSRPESEVQHPFIVYDNCHRSPSILIRPPCFSNRVRAADVADFPALDAHLAES